MDLTPEEKRNIYEEEKARTEAQEKAKNEIKVQQNKKNLKWGCVGCLSIIIFSLFVGLIITLLTSNKEEKTQQTQKRGASFEDIGKYLSLLRNNGISDALVVDVAQGRIDGEVKITVTNAWHVQPYQIRLQGAQNLWKLWANIHSPSKPDNAYISLVDFNNNRVGGSRGGAGSLIWVQKE